MLENLHIGAEVIGNDSQRLGTLKRIVIERADDRVTHIVVDPGLVESGNLLAPGGWEKPRERLVSVASIAEANEEHIRLALDEASFRKLPLFESEQHIEVETPDEAEQQRHESWRSRFRLGDLVNYIAAGWGVGAAPYQPPSEVRFNEARGSAEISEDTPVWRLNPHEEVGDVERVLIAPETQRASALVIRRKGIGSQRLVLPIAEVRDVDDGVVHIVLSDAQLDALELYHSDSEIADG